MSRPFGSGLWFAFMKHGFPMRTTAILALALGLGGGVRAGTATDITGLYYTGVNNSGGLLAGGTTDSHWSVNYASTNGGTSSNSTYMGAAYVVSGTYIDSAWTQNTSTAQWIVAPGARTSSSGGSVNAGGDFLPGNGSSGANNGIFVYTLAFNIVGTGTGTVTNDVSINITLSADDRYRVYVNPAGNGTTDPTGSATAAGSALNAWNNTTAVILQNGTNGTGTSGNAIFRIGTNYLTVVVENTNSIAGSSTNTGFNPSGLLVYQVGSATLINGQPIPEVGAWLPLAGALALYGVWVRRRRRSGGTPVSVQ